MIRLYVRDVRQALAGECWFAALSLALALPDICGMVEFPGASVAERYIGWYDRYVGRSLSGDGVADQTPYPSGEVVYNLRNTFLHQGAPTVVGEKVKEARNRLDRFTLMLGDGTRLHTMAMTVNVRDVAVRTLVVDATWLCATLCDSAESYYRGHSGDFDFGYSVLPQWALFGKESPLDDLVGQGDPLGELLQEKLNAAGHALRFEENVTDRLLEGVGRSLKRGNSPELPARATGRPEPAKAPPPAPRPGQPGGESRREHQLRCLFGQQFREERFVRKKEAIIGAALAANTRMQLNDSLTRLFPGEDVKIILGRLRPLIRDLPGR